MIAEIQVLPRPAGTEGAPYAAVDAAIGVIQGSGLRYEVGALGTTIEGEPDEVWPVLQAAHKACLGAGATSIVTVIKVFESTEPERPGMDTLVAKFRQ